MRLLALRPLAASLFILHAGVACRQSPELDTEWATRSVPAEGHQVDQEMADVGSEIFRTNCSACHYIGGDDPEAGLGPNLAGVTARRTMAWLRGMIANPDSMVAADSIAGALRDEYGIQMLNVGASPAEVRALIEFLWRADHPGAGGQAPTDSFAP